MHLFFGFFFSNFFNFFQSFNFKILIFFKYISLMQIPGPHVRDWQSNVQRGALYKRLALLFPTCLSRIQSARLAKPAQLRRCRMKPELGFAHI